MHDKWMHDINMEWELQVYIYLVKVNETKACQDEAETIG